MAKPTPSRGGLRVSDDSAALSHLIVMPGLDPGIHAVSSQRVEASMAWIAGSSPAMTWPCTTNELLFDLFDNN
ncbi:MAG: hypothetical protein L0210_13860 [Rhodospirillales bacterium]|nr:hypothetical protein [Rhodospirillales bacterium]